MVEIGVRIVGMNSKTYSPDSARVRSEDCLDVWKTFPANSVCPATMAVEIDTIRSASCRRREFENGIVTTFVANGEGAWTAIARPRLLMMR